MCLGAWKGGKQCTRPVRKDGACTVHYINPDQILKAQGKFKKCPCPEHKFTASQYDADFVPLEDFMKPDKSEVDVHKNCYFCITGA